MTGMTDDVERVAEAIREAFCEDPNICVTIPIGTSQAGYLIDVAAKAALSAQPSTRAAVVEECARVIDVQRDGNYPGSAAHVLLDELAAALRSLAPSPKENDDGQ